MTIVKELLIKLGAKVDEKGFKKFDQMTEKARKKAEENAKRMYERINSASQKSASQRQRMEERLAERQNKIRETQAKAEQNRKEKEYNQVWKNAEREQQLREKALRFEQTVRAQMDRIRERQEQQNLARIKREEQERIKANRNEINEEKRKQRELREIQNNKLAKAHSMKSVGTAFKNTGERGMALFGAGIMGTAKTAGNIEAMSNQVRAFGGYDKKDMPEVAKLAKSISLSTAFNQLELLTGMKELGKAGYKKQDLAHLMTILPNFATASDTTFDQGAVLATDVMSTFGYKVKQAGKVTDILTTALNESKLNFDDFSYSLKYSAPSAKAVGLKLEKLSAFLAILSQSGIKGSTAGTGLRKIFSSLSDEQKNIKTNKNLKARQKATASSLGLKIYDKEDNFDLTGVILQLAKKFKGIKKGQMMGILTDLFGLTAKNQAFLMIDALSDPNKLAQSNAIYNKVTTGYQGNTNRVAGVINTGYNFQQKQFENAKMSLENEIGKQFLPILTSATKEINNFINKLAETNPGILKFGAMMLFGGFVVSALISAIGSLLIFMAMARIAFIVLGDGALFAYAKMALPVIAAIAIGTALGFLLKYTYDWFGGWSGIWDRVKNIFSSVGGTLKNTLGGAIDWVLSKLSGLGNVFGSVFSGISQKFSNFVSGLKLPNFSFNPQLQYAGASGGNKTIVINNKSSSNVNMSGTRATAQAVSGVIGSQNKNMNQFFNDMANSFIK